MLVMSILFVCLCLSSISDRNLVEYHSVRDESRDYTHSCDVFRFYAEVVKEHWSIENVADCYRSRVLLVRGLDGQGPFTGYIFVPLISGDDYVVVTDTQGEAVSYKDFDEGDIVLITVDSGDVMQSYPGQIFAPLSIQLMDSEFEN